MIITVGGSAASGKTTLARNLAKALDFKHVSAGEIMRDMAAEKGMTLLEFSEYAENNPEVDNKIDERQRREASGDCVVDGRLSRHFLNPDLSIWLTAPIKERAERIIQRGESYKDIDDAVKAIRQREESEVKRYREFYKIDLTDLKAYDLVINTGKFGIREMTELSLEAVKQLNRS
jgi:cytidylate kinase